MRPVRAATRSMSIVVVGQDAAERSRLMTTLVAESTAGEFTLAEAGDADNALAIFRREHPDLILISTEGIDACGRLVATRVRQEEGIRHTGMIFIDHRQRGATSDDDGGLSVTCLEMGADDFLRHGAPDSELMARVRAVLRLKAMTDELRSANHQLRILSMTDDLTGLPNMRSFNQSFGDVVRRCRKGMAPLAVMMMDLDHFKSVNDTANHLVGSHVLAEVGRLFREKDVLGPKDVAARYGGDEFIALLAADTVEEAAERAEAVRRLIEARLFEKGGCTISITASIGIAWVPAGFNGPAEDVVKAADMMLYRSKNQGRNQVSAMVFRYPIDFGDGSGRTVAARVMRQASGVEEEFDTLTILKRR